MMEKDFKENTRWYVYAWFIDGRVIYYGKGCGNRINEPHNENKELMYLCSGKKVERRILYNNLTEEEALTRESEQICDAVFNLGYGLCKFGFYLNDLNRYLANHNFGDRAEAFINEDDIRKRINEISINSVSRYPTLDDPSFEIIQPIDTQNANIERGLFLLQDEATKICKAIIDEYFGPGFPHIRCSVTTSEWREVYKSDGHVTHLNRDVIVKQNTDGRGTVYEKKVYLLDIKSYVFQWGVEYIVSLLIGWICHIYGMANGSLRLASNRYRYRNVRFKRVVEKCGLQVMPSEKWVGYWYYRPTYKTKMFCDQYGISNIDAENKKNMSCRLASAGGVEKAYDLRPEADKNNASKQKQIPSNSNSRKYFDPETKEICRTTKSGRWIPSLTACRWLIRGDHIGDAQSENQVIGIAPRPKVIYYDDFRALVELDRELQNYKGISEEDFSDISEKLHEIVTRKYFWETETENIQV